MNPIADAAATIQRHCEDNMWRFCFIGGIAVLRWGQPRLTRDVDLTILAAYGEEQPVIDALLQRYTARIADARTFALANRVVLLRADNGVPVDIALGAVPFEERAVARSSSSSFLGHPLRTCSAEDLIVMKAFAGREQDRLDIRTVIIRQGARLDTRLVLDEVRPLLAAKGASDEIEWLERQLQTRPD